MEIGQVPRGEALLDVDVAAVIIIGLALREGERQLAGDYTQEAGTFQNP